MVHTSLTLNLLEALGFVVNNYPKSQLEPSQVIDYLGFVNDSVKKELQLPKIKAEANAPEPCLSKELATLIGRLAAAILIAPLHYRSLQELKHQALATAGYNGLSPGAREDLL